MPILGASTQHFRTYGKRKTNVINRRVPLGGWDASPLNEAAAEKGDKGKGRWSDSSSEEESEEVEQRAAPSKATTTTKPPVAARRSNFSLVIEVPRPLAASQDKENLATRTRARPPTEKEKVVKPSTTKKAIAKVDLPSSDDEEIARSALRPKSAKFVRTKSRHTTVVRSESDESVALDSDLDLIEDRPSPTFADGSDDEELASCSSEEELSSPLALPALSTLPFPPSLAPLLSLTLSPTSTAPFAFTSFLSSPPSPLSPSSSSSSPAWRKIGEASYSEVFSTRSAGGEEMVVKIIPIAPIDGGKQGERENDGEEMPYMSEWEAVGREIEVSRLLGGEKSEGGLRGFVRFKGAFLVQGAYPAPLVSAWDTFRSSRRSSLASDEQIRPSCFPDEQLYALILLEHAGEDLESWRLGGWREAKGIWEQVVDAVGRAEEEVEFEHRDLHWGNILIQPSSPSPASSTHLTSRLSSLSLTPGKSPPRSLSAGVKATLIDFTLSRVRQPHPTGRGRSSKGKGKVLFDGFEDECVFEGQGDHQFDVYRSMRTLVEQEGGGWEGFHPRTNVLWLHYLLRKLLYSKKLKAPSSPPSPAATPATGYSSPVRAVPSPRKTRRHSLMLASSSSSSLPFPTGAERKSRTLPSSAMLAKQRLSEKQRKEMEDEYEAWESLRRGEKALEHALRDLLGKGSGKRATKGTGRTRGKKVPAKEEEGGRVTFASAKAFGTWWNAQHN
ncbi:hypothetical protein JCM5296_006630 [Sporobolomyces johnsonii]